MELADLSHSFLMRQGKQVPVDFEKLFQYGDLSQNIALEPNDYLYFALSSANEIYVVGEVQSPGLVPREMICTSSMAGFRHSVLELRAKWLNDPGREKCRRERSDCGDCKKKPSPLSHHSPFAVPSK